MKIFMLSISDFGN